MVVDDGIAYPDSDGEPIGETDLHVDDILYMRVALKEHFRETPDVYVTSNLLLFYQKGEPEKFVVPDVMIVRGVSKEMRRNYLLRKEGAAPGLIVEVTSDQTWERDLSTRMELSGELGGAGVFFVRSAVYCQARASRALMARLKCARGSSSSLQERN